jgi:hypothetical protein
VSCPSANFCATVDDVGNVLTYKGSSWSSPMEIDADYLASVSCPSSSFCVAVDDSGDALFYNGSSWSSPTEIDPDNLIAVSCPSANFCTAVDQEGNALTYTATTAGAPTVTAISPTSGPTSGGTTVSITGTGFTGATKVVFGTVAATSFSVVSATRITAVSPAQAAGFHNIYVTTPSGTSAPVAADRFTYT